MKLYYTSSSPFARKVRIVLLEADIGDQIELITTTVRDQESPLLALSPAGKVPVLHLADGTVLTEASYICAYLDQVFDEVRLLPDGEARWAGLELEGMACGLLEGTVTWVRALRAPQALRNPKAIALEADRVNRCLDYFEQRVGEWNDNDTPLQLPQITVTCALGALSFRMPEFEWQTDRPALVAWWSAVSLRQSVAATEPFDV